MHAPLRGSPVGDETGSPLRPGLGAGRWVGGWGFLRFQRTPERWRVQGESWRAACRHRPALVRSRPRLRMVLEPRAACGIVRMRAAARVLYSRPGAEGGAGPDPVQDQDGPGPHLRDPAAG